MTMSTIEQRRARAIETGGPVAVAYADRSIAALSAAQAAGTASVLPALDTRRIVMINPPADCTLSIVPGAARGWPLFANVPNTIAAPQLPAGALYITGLATGAVLTIWEA